MKAYKIELLVIDFEDIGEKEIKNIIEQNKFISPQIKSIEERDIGEWSDDHPLNKLKTANEEYNKIFK